MTLTEGQKVIRNSGKHFNQEICLHVSIKWLVVVV